MAPATMPTPAFTPIEPSVPNTPPVAAAQPLDRVAQRRHAVHQDAAAHEEHRGGAGHRQRLHQPRRRGQDAAAQGLRAALARWLR